MCELPLNILCELSSDELEWYHESRKERLEFKKFYARRMALVKYMYSEANAELCSKGFIVELVDGRPEFWVSWVGSPIKISIGVSEKGLEEGVFDITVFDPDVDAYRNVSHQESQSGKTELVDAIERIRKHPPKPKPIDPTIYDEDIRPRTPYS